MRRRINQWFLKVRFLAYGVLGLMDEWVTHDFRESPEEMTKMVHQFGRFEGREYLFQAKDKG